MSCRIVPALVLCSALLGCAPTADTGPDSGGARPSQARPSGQIGATSPPLELQTLDGAQVSLAGLRGRPVLLNIWATWCHPCQDEIPVLEALYGQYRARGLEIVGVTIDGSGRTDDIRDFARRYGMTYPIWHDPDQRVMPAFSVIGVPTSFLISHEGKVLWRKTGEVKADDRSLAAALDSAVAAAAPTE